jgi:hypothetical protein
MKDEHDILREHADVLRALEERPLSGTLQVPERVLFDLEETRQKALQACKRPPKASFIHRHSGFLRLAAVLALLAAFTWLVLPHAPATARVVITSPGDEITETTPHIAWNSKDKPGQKYDVWILPGGADHLTAPALFVAKSVTSPLRFEDMQHVPGVGSVALQPGTDYQVLVCLADAGRMAGVPVPFRVKALLPP